MQITYTRPPQINSYAKQKEFIDCEDRYAVIEASTKAGKTTGCIVWLFESALQGKEGHNFWWVAPVYAQAEIAYFRLKRFISDKSIFDSNDSKKQIRLINGAVIHFKSAEKPDNLYGEDVYGVVMDEYTRMAEEAWFAIRTTVSSTGGKMRFIGNVKGTKGWGYKLAREAEKGKPGWKYLKITADDVDAAGIRTKDGRPFREEVEEARLTLPTPVFLELYYCIPNQSSSDKFCYAFDKAKHVGKCSVNPLYPIYLSFDFNVNPISVCVIQCYNNRIYVPHVIQLENSNTRKLAEFVRNKFPVASFIVTGDMSGNARKTSAELTDYMIIKNVLKLSTASMKQLVANPPLEENQTLVNGVLEHFEVTMDPDNAAKLIFDCEFVEVDARGKIKKADRDDPTQQADALDGFRYFLTRFYHLFKSRLLGG